MTSTASPDSVDPATGEQERRPDELEHWLTDLRVNLSEDTHAWLRPDSDTEQAAGELSGVPRCADGHSGREAGTTASSIDPSGTLNGVPPRPVAGRHRAAD